MIRYKDWFYFEIYDYIGKQEKNVENINMFVIDKEGGEKKDERLATLE
ncbi:MAG: hypothetical protein ACTSRG_07610 [Candidatus Helarchaeota archaeon]